MAIRDRMSFVQCASIQTRVRENAFVYGLTAITAVSLKYQYGTASAEELYWLLAPLARLIERLAGIRFDWVPPNGFVSTTYQVIIAPACSGITFLVICFCALSFSLVHRRRSPVAKLLWVALALVTAYAVTLGANTARIVAAVYLYRANIYGEWITPERVHRMVGIVVYLSVLLPIYLTADRITRRKVPPVGSRLSRIRAYFPPFVWYILFTIMIPVLTALGRRDVALPIEHVLVVGTACLSAFAMCIGLVIIRVNRVDMSGGEREDDSYRALAVLGIKTIKEPEAKKR